MHGNFFNITLKNVHNIKATHGNAPSPLRGEGEGSFDINIGTKKQSLSVQDAIFLSISIICFSRIFLSSHHPPSYPHPPWFNPAHPPPPPTPLPRAVANSLTTSPIRLPPSGSPASTVSGCPSVFHHPARLMTLLMTGNEFGNVNCKGPQGKARGGAERTESPGRSLQRGGKQREAEA